MAWEAYRNVAGQDFVAGTREITAVAPFVIVYRVLATEVQVLRIWHAAQDRDA